MSLKESITEPTSLALFAGTRIRFQRNGIDWKVNDIIFTESFFKKQIAIRCRARSYAIRLHFLHKRGCFSFHG